MRYVRHTPSLRRHKPSQQAVVTIDGIDHYLGDWSSRQKLAPPEVQEAYDALIAEWLAGGRSLPSTGADKPALTVNDLILRFWKHAELHYRRPDGSATQELGDYKHTLRPLRELYGRIPACEFSPLKLKAVRQRMLDNDLCRNVINQRIRRIVRMFKWSVSEELVEEGVFRALTTVRGLARGRTAARETEPVKPVPDVFVDAILPYVRDPVRAMIELQRRTGMRPGEVVTMRGIDLDTTGKVWLYRPGSDQGPEGQHKTAHHGKARIVAIGPQAQEVIKPFLKLDTMTPLFSPRDAEARRRAEQRRNRKTRVQPSQQQRRRKKPRKTPGDRYTVCSYDQAIRQGCKRASVPHWSPNRLRHSHASEVRRRYGLEAAQVALGHSQADVTQIYAERDLGLAVKVAAEIG